MRHHAPTLLNDFIIGFQRDPERHAEDSEWKRELYSAFYQHFDRLGLKFAVDKAKMGIGYYKELPKVEMNPVRSAYPTAEKFDLAVLDLDQEPQLPGEGDAYTALWSQPVALAITLHLCPPEQDPAKYLYKLDRDLKKMGTYRDTLANGENFCGLAILVMQGLLPDMDGLTAGHPELGPGLQAWVIAEDEVARYQGQ